jgi:hypothetical protein
MATTAAARLRGTAAGAFTAALAVAAHGIGGGDMVPSGGSAVLLAVLAAAVGAFARSCSRTADLDVLVAVLAGGQIVGHLALGAGGHGHTASATLVPSPVMLLTHLVAVAVGATLIRGCERLCTALSAVLRSSPYRRAERPATSCRTPDIRADHPMRRIQLIAVSISHRGPPGLVVY